jgi:6,7-dimethyl-8-ribityllumazine synthase
MSTTGNNALQKGIPQLKDAFIVIVKTEWNKNIVDKLESGADKYSAGAKYQIQNYHRTRLI